MGFAATESPIVPLAVPLVPDVMLSQDSWLTADHWQPAPVAKLKLVVPPLPETEYVDGVGVNVQLACVGTLNAEPSSTWSRVV